ncbi:MAG: tol-pal system protein YbgF [Alphaproteobacteria bacterium]|nr:tol-pal system protein YbgF [Alphaproteobacteria bacterium]
MSKIKYVIAGICLISSVSITSAANTYSGNTIENRLNRVEKDLRILNKEVYSNGVSPLSKSSQSMDIGKAQIADFEIRLSSLEENLRKTKGQMEVLTHQQNELKTQMEKVQKDIDFRLNEMEKQKTIEVKKAKKELDLSAFKKTDSVKEELSPEKQYSKAFELLKLKDFEKAEKAFAEFITKNPEHKLAGNAQYWLSETFYVRGNMEEAMKQFAVGYKKYNKSQKATDNLLKLGITLGAIGRTSDACLTLAELEKNYSPLPKTIANRMKNEQNKLKCSK